LSLLLARSRPWTQGRDLLIELMGLGAPNQPFPLAQEPRRPWPIEPGLSICELPPSIDRFGRDSVWSAPLPGSVVASPGPSFWSGGSGRLDEAISPNVNWGRPLVCYRFCYPIGRHEAEQAGTGARLTVRFRPGNID
jgi:hypothetical protein